MIAGSVDATGGARMDFRFTPEEDQFRAEVREFFQREWTPLAEEAEAEREGFIHNQQFAERLAQRGWLTMAWPKEYGGQGAGYIQQTIFREESAYYRAPDGGQGPRMVGPMLIVHGNEEQKRRFLPPISRAEVFWCQGYSEPGAGSDLASLQLRAGRDGDDYILNGQKIWTSNAHKANWIHVLGRTDPEAPKHRGISYFLVDMKTPGVSTRPIVNMAGGAGFYETFFEDVRVPKENLIGEENRGWYVAATTLDFERSAINYPAEGRRTLDELTGFLRQQPAFLRKPGVREKLAELSIEIEVARHLAYRVAFMQAIGRVPNYEASIAKVFGTEMQQRLANAAVGVLGAYGALQRGTPWTPLRGYLEFKYQWQTSPTIFAGTSEVQRNIIANRGLGLPRE
jgi:alkylation response protein AidB-like acyl-CoA dehydrogenase